MSDFEKGTSHMADYPNPPPYTDQQPQGGPDPMKQPIGLVPPMGYGAAAPMPTQYQGYYMPPGSVPTQGPILQQPQTIYLAPVQPVKEPDYLAYSIFTMICCCIPLGIAALVYAVQTREANQAANLVNAKRNSNLARTFAHTALGVGLALWIVYIAIIVFFTTSSAIYVINSSP